jgi:hypothetical protein
VTYEPPTNEEIGRVGEYWRRLKLLTCTHDSGVTFRAYSENPVCTQCDEPVRFFSIAQLEARRLQPTGDEVRDGLLDQMKRGGVRFAIDGQWHEVRFHAHPFPGIAVARSAEEECICLQVSEVEKMLRATEAHR